VCPGDEQRKDAADREERDYGRRSDDSLRLKTPFGWLQVSGKTAVIIAVIAGVGFLRRLSAVRWGVAGRVVLAWFFTIPGAALLAALAWWFLQLFHSVSAPAAGN